MNDISLTRDVTGRLRTNVPCAIVLGKPTAFDVGHISAESGALALNILHTFLPPAPDGIVKTYDLRLLTRDALPEGTPANTRIVCTNGVCSKRALDLRAAFVAQFLHRLTVPVGKTVTLSAVDIAAWIDTQELSRPREWEGGGYA